MEAMNFSPRDMLSELEGSFSATFGGRVTASTCQRSFSRSWSRWHRL